MKSALPWTLAAVLFVAFAASFSELQRMRGRFGEVSRHQFHDHQDVREFFIRSSMAGVDQPIVVLGDSLAEMAEFPRSLCGKPVINAGIGGSSSSDWERIAPTLLKASNPSAVVIALGANDGRNENRETLLREIMRISPIVISAPTEPANFAPSEFIDGIHLTKKASAEWVKQIEKKVESSLPSCD